jgi:hypothetical protein
MDLYIATAVDGSGYALPAAGTVISTHGTIAEAVKLATFLFAEAL